MLHIKIFARRLLQNKFYSLNNILGLAIGIACAIVILLWVRFETGFDRFHENIDRLYRVCFYTDTNNAENKVYYNTFQPGGITSILKENYPEIEKATFFAGANVSLAYETREMNAMGRIVHPDFPNMFSFPVIAGDVNTALSTPGNIVITEKVANQLFADETALGKQVLMSGGSPVTIGAVMKNTPANSNLQFDFMFPFEMAPPIYKSTNVKAGEMYVMLDGNNDVTAVDQKIINAYNDLNPDSYPNYLFLQPVKDIHLRSLEGKGGRIIYIYIFSALALFVLAMACINYINLATARATIRAREIAVKKVIGAGRATLVKQFLLESILYTFAALVLAIMAVKLALPAINALLGQTLQFHISSEWMTLGAILLLTGLAAGGYPAFFMSSLLPIGLLKGNAGNNIYAKPSRLRKLLVTVQYSLAIFFLICISIIYNQMNYFQTKSLGFDKENIIIVPLQYEATSKSQVLKNELMKNSTIQNVTLSQFDMTLWQASGSLDWPGKDPNNVFDVGFNRVDADFQKTFGLQITDGRFFSNEYPSDLTSACIVNEEAVRAMNLDNPVGQQITWGKDSPMAMTGKIVGVVKDFHTESLHKPIRPFVLFNANEGSQLYVKVMYGKTGPTLKTIEKVYKDMFPNSSFSYTFMDDALYRHYQVETFTRTILMNITVLAVIITMLGLLGLATFNAERRTKEFGIRKVLGASMRSILKEMSLEYVLLGIIAMVISAPAAYFIMNKWLENFAYRANVTVWPFALAGVIVASITLVTIGSKALQIFYKRPADTLRYE